MNSATETIRLEPPVIPPKPDPGGAVQRLWPVIGILVAVGACALVFVFNPSQHAFYPRCFLFELTGIYCPGCGGLRSAHQLFHGHVLTALQFNALFVLSLPVLTAWLAWRFLGGGRAPLAKTVPSFRWLWLALAVVAIFTVLRNFPAFAWLAP